MYIYMYICKYIYVLPMYIYVYSIYYISVHLLHRYLCSFPPPICAPSSYPSSSRPQVRNLVERSFSQAVALYKILLYFSSFVHESIVLSFFRPACIAHTVAIVLHGYWAIYNPPSTSLLYARHFTILVIKNIV